jgi:hypothetical protein
VRGFPRPLLDISAANFGKIIEQALNATLDPPFNPYENSVNFLIASYIIPYVGLTGYVGANPKLLTPQARKVRACISRDHSPPHHLATAIDIDGTAPHGTRAPCLSHHVQVPG